MLEVGWRVPEKFGMLVVARGNFKSPPEVRPWCIPTCAPIKRQSGI